MELQRESRRRYESSPARKASHRRYESSPAGKASTRRYESSPAGKASRRRYASSPAGKASHRRYESSPAGKASKSASHRRYESSPAGKASKSASKRRIYQRRGKGVHMARIGDWEAFFDSLASDGERCIAAHVLMWMSGFDQTAGKIVADPSFDYNYIGEHFDVS